MYNKNTYYVQILACIMYRFQHVLCADFSMYYVQILACLMWIAVQTGSPFGSLGSLCSLASVHVESTCEISSILSLVPDSPNHATCLPDRARRLPDMSPIRHQASLANSMYIYIYIYIYGNVPWVRDKENMIKGIIRVFQSNTFNTSSLPMLVVALRVSPFFFFVVCIFHKN